MSEEFRHIYSPVPPTPLDPDAFDRPMLEARLNQLRQLYASRPKHFQAPPGMVDEVAIAAARAAFDAETQHLIREQIATISFLRRTSAGPAKKGGKRAKSAPLDLSSMMAQLAKAQ